MPIRFPTLRTIAGETQRVAGRYPLAVASAAVATVLSVVGAEAEHWIFPNALMAAGMGVPLFFGLKALRERRPASKAWRNGLLDLAAALALGAFAGSVPSDYRGVPAVILIRFLLLDLGLHFAVAFVPAAAGEGEAAFWQFNRRLFLRFALAALYSGVLFLGLVIALASADHLFELKVKGTRYFQLWLVMAGFFHPLFFLGGAEPAAAAEPAAERYPRGLRAFAQFALAPLVLVFAAILYAYAVKILAERAWPHGWVAGPICVFAVVGILAALLLEPLRAVEEERWARWYWRVFFPVLGPLALLLLLSLRERAGAYGLTVDRYYGFAVGGWLLAVSITFALRPRANVRWLPASLAALCFLTLAGPWSAFALSKRSQVHQLLTLMEAHGGVASGHLVLPSRKLTEPELDRVDDIVSGLWRTYGTREVEPLLAEFYRRYPKSFRDDADDTRTYADKQELRAFLGGRADRQMAAMAHGTYRSARLARAVEIPTDGHRTVYYLELQSPTHKGKAGKLQLELKTESPNPVVFSVDGRVLDSTPFLNCLRGCWKRPARSVLDLADMSATLRDGDRQWLVVIELANGEERPDDSLNLDQLHVLVLGP